MRGRVFASLTVACWPLWIEGKTAQGAATRPVASEGFSFDSVREQARVLSTRPYAGPDTTLPEQLRKLNYDTYRLIWYRRDKQVWAGTNLQHRLEFSHRGYIFLHRVDMNLLENGQITPVRFSTDLFEYHGEARPEQLPKDLGFAGFRVLCPLNEPDRFDELISFLGTNYFRALGRGQVYGASARGLAIDTGLGEAEEFPFFNTFWIRRPEPEKPGIVFFAIMDSPSTTGAYEFAVQPGEDTVVQIRADLFLRRSIRKLGIAPLSSMFLFGEDGARPSHEHRPQVHDSDGLLVAGGDGQWIWRPLDNPQRLTIDRFEITRLRGFGLLQRDRRFDHYLDREANYHRRPSIWVEPGSDWEPGAVELIEWPSAREGYDNVATFWVPAAPVLAGQQRSLRYRLHFCMTCPATDPAGRTVATRRVQRPDGSSEFQVEFRGDTLARLDPASPPEAVVAATHAAVRETAVTRNNESGSWCVRFAVTADGNGPPGLRLFLRRDREPLTETWSYTWQPPN